jgi:hypothetical protein
MFFNLVQLISVILFYTTDAYFSFGMSKALYKRNFIEKSKFNNE